ncbi:MAG: metalloregulator ArsR/SmtB family transcription factor [Acidimicrobiia bacterium]
MTKALGHPARVRMLRLLAARTCVTGDLVAEFTLAQSTVSGHLRMLREAGLVRGTIDETGGFAATSTATIDANEAVASVAYRASEIVAIYPITPASPMG